ncbi:MAG: hypothetical protein JWR40_3902 [Massilia sp.]|jgi:hypothetical protein|nr:hypothetical protein [Massilia sp.]
MVPGSMFAGVAALRFEVHQPVRAAAVAAGIFALAATASLLGRCSRTQRTFLALFLFWLYVASQATRVPMVDAVGFNGAANVQSVLAYLAIGMALVAAGYCWNRRSA